MSFFLTEGFASAAVASGGTFDLAYPVDGNGDAMTPGHFQNTRGHKLWVNDHQRMYDYIDDFTLSFGASDITVTYNGSTEIPAGSRLHLQLDVTGRDDGDPPAAVAGVIASPVYILDLGAPDVADPDGVAAAQAVAGAGNLTLDGALAADGVAIFDVPRGVEIDSSGAGDTTQTATVTGTDAYGETVVETIAFNGTTAVNGKKAFKTVTQVAISAALAGNATAGTTDVLGLPCRLPDTGYVLKELEDGAAATAGTVVAAVDSAASATTGDVRGTYNPNSAADGAKAFRLVVAGVDPADAGVAQYAG